MKKTKQTSSGKLFAGCGQILPTFQMLPMTTNMRFWTQKLHEHVPHDLGSNRHTISFDLPGKNLTFFLRNLTAFLFALWPFSSRKRAR